MKKEVTEITTLVRKHILSLKPYSSARDDYEGTEGVFLDANENPLGTPGGGQFNRYPDPYQRELKVAIASLKGVRPEQIFLGNGSDEPIDLLFRAFCEPITDQVLICPPTYGMYQVSAALNRVPVLEVPLTPEFQLDLPALFAALHPGVKMVFVCSPNNPSGNLMRQADILELLKSFTGLVVVDEAYIDFTGQAGFLPLLNQHPRLLVLQTFSKAWGMAGLRLGMAFAHPEVVQVLNKIKPPYNINSLTQAHALQALRSTEAIQAMRAMKAEILQNRSELAAALGRLPVVQHIYPSDANFLLIKTTDANRIYQQLVEQLVIVRNRSSVTLCEHCLRISVGTAEENRQLLQAMENLG